MTGCAIVVGASKGIGKSLVISLASSYPSLPIIAIARGISSQESEFSSISSNIKLVDADISTQEGLSAILDCIEHKVQFLILNAAIEGLTWDEMPGWDEWDKVMNTNAGSHFFLARDLRSKYTEDARILFISSRDSKSYLIPLSFYCISKAAQNMVYEVIKAEIPEVSVGWMDPGVVETALSEYAGQKVPEAKSLEKLSPLMVAKFLRFLLSDKVGPIEFSSEMWNIYEEKHHTRWVEKGDIAPKNPD
ncbi:unnamed protein product [Blepharisma stoltei]|uniref:Uncharacterized protein n=1 Tax=Blepharisma stoltei TaxID=1481888 RepID=A0AAU9JAT5_9CILI|nr:unnamed protein product [Blepharisma stoltei]